LEDDSKPKRIGVAPHLGERRQVTVLFADMVGFTEISERLGEEGTYTLIQPLYELMATAVREQGGSVKDFTGDGIMALFGYPKALEDAPIRACRAGLLIQERLRTILPEIELRHGVKPQMRIGINSGLAVVTHIHDESAAHTALGDTVNLASRLQAIAKPDTVILSESTYRLAEGLLQASFEGKHAIKGKSEPQAAYRLEGIRLGATRFDAAISRGLTTYIGRDQELKTLELANVDARHQLIVVDIAAEPGMGKSRLVHEFRTRVIERQRSVFLTGNCSPDSRQTPLAPFIDVVRGSFEVRVGEEEHEIRRKLEIGLGALGFGSQDNLALLLVLLGLPAPAGTLAGLDNVLIGLRTRDLLEELLRARCRVSSTILLLEDLHWIDSASEEFLSKIISENPKLPLLIVHTRRPEYKPRWLINASVSQLSLEPLSADEITSLVKARLGVDALPESLGRQVAERSEGNALFAEEIISFLLERGALRARLDEVEVQGGAISTALPASIQDLLAARVDQLAPRDRALLQIAAVIGRRFDLALLAAASNGEFIDVNTRLRSMQAIGLVYPVNKSNEYVFKHALLRDALYQSLLTGQRAALHLKIGEEVEHRSGNRLAETAESLAYHYGQTDRADKAIVYLTMVGAKCLAAYSLDEAGVHFAAVVDLVRKAPASVTDEQLVGFLVDYLHFLNVSLRHRESAVVFDEFKFRLDRLGDNERYILLQHHYVFALLWSIRYRDAEAAQNRLSAMAARLQDVRSKAYALASAIHLSTIINPQPIEIFERLSNDAIACASTIDDPYIQGFVQNLIGWEEMHRGRMGNAHAAANQLMAVGRQMNDPRAMGYGKHLLAWIAMTHDDYPAALDLAEKCISIARTPFDRESARNAKIIALVSLRRPEAFEVLRDWLDHCAKNDWIYISTIADGIWGVALVLHGNVGAGLRWIEQAIRRREQEGYRTAADWYRLFLCEIYLEILAGKEKPSLAVLVTNIATLLRVLLTAKKQIPLLISHVRQNPQPYPTGHHVGRCEMILGLLYKITKQRGLAIQHLSEARQIEAQFGPTPTLRRIDQALAQLDARLIPG
jgi:class 3 adenylate cyclase